MENIASVTLDVADIEAAERFYSAAFGPDTPLRFRASQEPSTGFRGFTLALTVPQPADVDLLVDRAVAAGATVLKPVTKSMWGYAGVVRAPDGAIWKIATSARKNAGPATGRIDAFVLLIGVADVAASKRFYTEHGLTVSKGFGRVYAEFDPRTGPVTLALYRRRALAKDLGVAPEGTGSPRLTVGGSGTGFTDPDGFAWEAASPALSA
ncbi:VOC family protein [Streptomyces sp. NPDC085612]|uniref:VOC family protein n=1 Tax=Streptomyces sp. NPDC085612 TaxID=3365732 RepID=UPI0037D8E1AC